MRPILNDLFDDDNLERLIFLTSSRFQRSIFQVFSLSTDWTTKNLGYTTKKCPSVWADNVTKYQDIHTLAINQEIPYP